MKKILILIPIFNDWQSVLRLIENIEQLELLDKNEND